MNNKEYLNKSPKEILNQEKLNLLDPLAIDLAKYVQWWEIKDNLNNCNYEYPIAIIGKGKPLLMLHGFDSCFLEFRRIVPLLSKHNKIIIPDMFGFGFCPRPKEAKYGKATILSHLGKVLALLNNKKPIGVIGASMGGGIAMELARLHPKQIDRLLLLSPAGLTGRQKPLPPLLGQIGVWFLSQPSVRKGLCKQAFANPKKDIGAPEEQIASIHLKVPGWGRSLAAFARQGGIANCGKPLPTQPLEVIWGANDRILKGKVKQESYRLLSNNIKEIEECGHLPHIDQPEFVAKRWLVGR